MATIFIRTSWEWSAILIVIFCLEATAFCDDSLNSNRQAIIDVEVIKAPAAMKAISSSKSSVVLKIENTHDGNIVVPHKLYANNLSLSNNLIFRNRLGQVIHPRQKYDHVHLSSDHDLENLTSLPPGEGMIIIVDFQDVQFSVDKHEKLIETPFTEWKISGDAVTLNISWSIDSTDAISTPTGNRSASDLFPDCVVSLRFVAHPLILKMSGE